MPCLDGSKPDVHAREPRRRALQREALLASLLQALMVLFSVSRSPLHTTNHSLLLHVACVTRSICCFRRNFCRFTNADTADHGPRTTDRKIAHITPREPR
jgi:hypothetical protein